MYGTRYLTTKTRIRPAFRPLIYQWILDAASILSFLHANDIMIGNINTRSFMLSFPDRASPPQAFLAGCPDAYFRSDDSGLMIRGAEYPCKDFTTDLNKVEHPTRATDIFLLGNIIYEFMTGYPPGLAWTDEEEPSRGLELPLEGEYLGDFVRKCWNGGYDGGDVDDLKKELIQFLRDRGLTIEDDAIQNLTMEELPEPREPQNPEHAWLPPSP